MRCLKGYLMRYISWVPSSYEVLITNLRNLRETNDLTQEKVAERSGLDYKHYQGIEAGRRPELRLSTVDKLAKAYELQAWQLLQPKRGSSKAPEKRVGRPPKKPASNKRPQAG